MILPVSRYLKRFAIHQSSMEPIFQKGDRILAGSVKLIGLKRGDVAFFKDAVSGIFRVKRVIGLPCEKLEIRNGGILINDRKLADYVHGLTHPSSHGPVLIPQDHYFLMGDRRDVSEDSRDFGPVPLERILYKALAIYRPFGHFKIL